MHQTYWWRRRLFHVLQGIGGLVAGSCVLWFLHSWWQTSAIPDSWPWLAALALAGLLVLAMGSVSLVIVDATDTLRRHYDLAEAQHRPPSAPLPVPPRALSDAEQGLALRVAQDLSRLSGQATTPPDGRP